MKSQCHESPGTREGQDVAGLALSPSPSTCPVLPQSAWGSSPRLHSSRGTRGRETPQLRGAARGVLLGLRPCAGQRSAAASLPAPRPLCACARGGGRGAGRAGVPGAHFAACGVTGRCWHWAPGVPRRQPAPAPASVPPLARGCRDSRGGLCSFRGVSAHTTRPPSGPVSAWDVNGLGLQLSHLAKINNQSNSD